MPNNKPSGSTHTSAWKRGAEAVKSLAARKTQARPAGAGKNELKRKGRRAAQPHDKSGKAAQPHDKKDETDGNDGEKYGDNRDNDGDNGDNGTDPNGTDPSGWWGGGDSEGDESNEGDMSVESLLRTMTMRGAGVTARRVLVKWKSLGHEESTWEPRKNLHPEALRDFEWERQVALRLQLKTAPAHCCLPFRLTPLSPGLRPVPHCRSFRLCCRSCSSCLPMHRSKSWHRST